jgi:hypothetical protein
MTATQPSNRYYTKDPDATLDYTLDWSEWLETDETIDTSTWIIPEGITTVRDSQTDTTATVWLSAGNLGQRYTATNRVVTSAGRTDDRSIYITIRNR